jgi:hypothetical protein
MSIIRTLSLAAVLILSMSSVAGGYESPYLGARARAAVLFDSANTAYLAHKYLDAGRLYAQANELSPSVTALIQAARAYWFADSKMIAYRYSMRLVLEYSYLDVGTSDVVGSNVLCLPADDASRLKAISNDLQSIVGQLRPETELNITRK